MDASHVNFYAVYGLLNVREAMKRPYAEAFPAWARPRATPPLPPAMPQLQSRVPAQLPQWMGYSQHDGEQAAKRRRIGGEETMPVVTPASSATPSAAVPAIRSQVFVKGSLEPVPPDVMQSRTTGVYWVPELCNADLFQAVNSLGLEIGSGMSFLSAMCAKHIRLTERGIVPMDMARDTLAFLALMVEKTSGKEVDLPEKLQKALVASAVRFLKNLYCHCRKSHLSAANDIEKMAIRFFNTNWAVLRLVKQYAELRSYEDYRFIGGEARFDFLLWCAKEKVLLSDSELERFWNLKGAPIPKEMARVYRSLQSADESEKNAS